MTHSEPAQTATRRIPRILGAGLLVVAVIAAIASALGYPVSASSSSTAASPIDGVVPDGTTVFDNEVPGVARLEPALLGALRQAATAAAEDGVEFVVTVDTQDPATRGHR